MQYSGNILQDTFDLFNQNAKDTMDGITRSISILIDKIGEFYAANPHLPVFCDFVTKILYWRSQSMSLMYLKHVK